MTWAWHDMASVNQTRPHCVNQMGQTHSKPSAPRHDKGMAWERHAMCESASKVSLQEVILTKHYFDTLISVV